MLPALITIGSDRGHDGVFTGGWLLKVRRCSSARAGGKEGQLLVFKMLQHLHGLHCAGFDKTLPYCFGPRRG